MEKVSQELAEQEFQRFGVLMDLDFDTKRMDQESREGFENHKRHIINAIISGNAVVNDKGEIEYTTKVSGKKIVFHEPEGSTYMAMDKRKEGESMAKSFAFMAAMTGEAPAVLSTLPNRDIKVLQAVTALFLA